MRFCLITAQCQNIAINISLQFYNFYRYLPIKNRVFDYIQRMVLSDFYPVKKVGSNWFYSQRGSRAARTAEAAETHSSTTRRQAILSGTTVSASPSASTVATLTSLSPKKPTAFAAGCARSLYAQSTPDPAVHPALHPLSSLKHCSSTMRRVRKGFHTVRI